MYPVTRKALRNSCGGEEIIRSSVTSRNHPMRTRLSGGVGAGRANLPAPRLSGMRNHSILIDSIEDLALHQWPNFMRNVVVS